MTFMIQSKGSHLSLSEKQPTPQLKAVESRARTIVPPKSFFPCLMCNKLHKVLGTLGNF